VRHSTILVCAGVLLSWAAASASAQLVFGSTSPTTTNPCAVYLDVNTGVTTTLWNSASNKKINGLASDPATGRLYSNDAARLNYWNYGSVGTVPTFIAGMYRTNDNVTFTATGVDALAFANGHLYGATKYGSTVYKRGIYEIATTSDGMATPHCVMTPLWLDPTGTGTNSGTIEWDGLDFNPNDNKFYVTNTVDTTGSGGTYTRGVFSVDAFGTGALVKAFDFPAGRTEIDGLAIGGGKFWLTEQVPSLNAIQIYPYDPITQTYGTTITFALTDSTQRATGACWAPNALPEPSTALALAFLGLLLRGRR
jgi:hypothetical protein